MGDDGKLQKMEVDYCSTVDEKIPECEKIAKNGNVVDAIEGLLSLEKQTRTGSDAISTGRLLVAIVKLCFDHKKWDLLNENIVLVTKRRGQLKQAVTKMVQEAYTYIEKTPDKETKLKLIDTLRTVTDGKIYVEIERARLTMILAKIREADGDISEAASVLQSIQVETFGSMEKHEKVEFILEQMRLCLATKDYIRTQIISKKINIKYFEDKDSNDLKLKFYQLMIELDMNEGSHLAICKHFRAILNTPTVQEDKAKLSEALQCVVLYLVLAPYDNEQSDLIHRVKGEKLLEDIEKYKDLMELFTTPEIINWEQFSNQYESELRKPTIGGEVAKVFNPNTEAGNNRWKELKVRVVEHNIRVMAGYYTRIKLSRMAELLFLSQDETEEFLSKLVVNKTVEAKVDRLDGIIHFQSKKDPNDILNDWSRNINSMMELVGKTTHLITKEEMIHKVLK